ncbi:unnamed protein product [Allacma fusca]|uniref:Uncharacterized protein n=1 Tax=Allacma fusca TaxID=39272 RepID=A0A8J2KDR6_9HEXA|nr:unnamed protein product [Allacma fusca]
MHNRAYRDVVTPVFFGASMALLIFSCYGSVRFYSTIPLPGYLLLPVMFAIICVFSVLLHHSSGNVYLSSVQFIQSRNISTDPYVRKTLKSFYTLKVYVGSAYFVRKDSIVTFVDCFTTNAVSLLLAF